jgi:hypothetical protein
MIAAEQGTHVSANTTLLPPVDAFNSWAPESPPESKEETREAEGEGTGERCDGPVK